MITATKYNPCGGSSDENPEYPDSAPCHACLGYGFRSDEWLGPVPCRPCFGEGTIPPPIGWRPYEPSREAPPTDRVE